VKLNPAAPDIGKQSSAPIPKPKSSEPFGKIAKTKSKELSASAGVGGSNFCQDHRNNATTLSIWI
jgi:hypothetical protein